MPVPNATHVGDANAMGGSKVNGSDVGSSEFDSSRLFVGKLRISGSLTLPVPTMGFAVFHVLSVTFPRCMTWIDAAKMAVTATMGRFRAIKRRWAVSIYANLPIDIASSTLSVSALVPVERPNQAIFSNVRKNGFGVIFSGVRNAILKRVAMAHEVVVMLGAKPSRTSVSVTSGSGALDGHGANISDWLVSFNFEHALRAQ